MCPQFLSGLCWKGTRALKVFQHNQCHAHCTYISPASFSLLFRVPSSSVKHSFASASPSLSDRIYCCLPTTFVLLVFIPQSRNAMPIFFFFLKISEANSIQGRVPHKRQWLTQDTETYPSQRPGWSWTPTRKKKKRPTCLKPGKGQENTSMNLHRCIYIY